MAILVAAHFGVAPARAAVYLLDNSPHHIGDGLFAPWSADARRLRLPTIGPKYAVAFCLTAPSSLKVVVANVLGIERGKSEGELLARPRSPGLALPYIMAKADCCGASMALRPIGPEGPGAPFAIGRLRHEHNHRGFGSRWTHRLEAGPYILTIESQPIPWTVPGDLDDLEFVGLGVAAKEAGAAVTPMGRAVIYRDRIPLDILPPLPCPPKH